MPSQDQAHGSEVEHRVGDEANVAEAEANVAEVGENVAEDVENVGEDEENVAEDEDGDDDGQAPVVPEEGYGGGPSDLSLLHEYHKHRANQIWEATNSEAPILKKVMRSVANGKKYFEDLAEVGNWNWGAAALVDLQAYMAKSWMGHISHAEDECVEIGYQLERKPSNAN
ncbi:hypothetical protein P8452_53038 [Trifolium repens]|nr:hypothetical protein P8452_53038 [Trifolium repens]